MRGRRQVLLYALAALILLSVYAAAAAAAYRPGFPLDDAWIHQTYARNWAETGGWFFQQGTPSSGSTAPLWSFLIGLGHLLRIDPLVWTWGLGWLCLAGLGLAASTGIRRLAPGKPRWAFWGGLLVMADWHLVWAAGSGMETLAFALLALVVLVLLLDPACPPFFAGLAIGIAVWLRPEGLALAGPVLAVTLLEGRTWGRKLHRAMALLAGVAIFTLPYFLFNFTLSGEVMPSTFFAKQAEYAAARETPFMLRLMAQLEIPLVGAGVVLIPWAPKAIAVRWRRRDWAALVGLAWLVGTAWLYAWRLPATYQHGRYLIPVVPVWLTWGIAALAEGERSRSVRFLHRVLSRSALLLIGIVSLVFYVLGAGAFSRDVSVIESEMVDTARWISQNIPEDALLAAHDIGALGFFGKRDLLDLAGLVSPEVIPILRDESKLRDYLDRRGASYLVTLEGWYPELESGGAVLFTTGASFSPALGGTNMVVYAWPSQAR